MKDVGSLKSKSVRLSQEQIESLERRAEEDKRDVSQVIRIALDEFLERQRARRKKVEASA